MKTSGLYPATDADSPHRRVSNRQLAAVDRCQSDRGLPLHETRDPGHAGFWWRIHRQHGSILGSVGFATSSAYVAAKHGVVGVTKTAALEYSAQGIRVNSVGPGFNTPLVAESLDAETLTALNGMHPIGRLGEPHEVANLVAFLGSDEASFCTAWPMAPTPPTEMARHEKPV